MLRRKDLTRVHEGVFVDHTGRLTWEQRAWVAVLATGGALTHESALARPLRSGPVHVAIGLDRTVRPPARVKVHRSSGLDARLHPTAAPPRVLLEHATLDVADAAPDDGDAFTVLADAIHSRETTADVLLDTLARRPRMRRRTLLSGALRDLESGACSVLEQAYLHRVERAHGLPVATRQARDEVDDGVVRRDVLYDPWRVVVELDGRTHHDSPQARHRDLRRDLSAAASRELVTVRVGHAQVLGDPCTAARDLARLLRRAGWLGEVRQCSACPDEPA